MICMMERPVWTGSPPIPKTIGMVVVAALAAKAAGVFPGGDNGDLAAGQVGRHRRQKLVSVPFRDIAAPDRYPKKAPMAFLALATRVIGQANPCSSCRSVRSCRPLPSASPAAVFPCSFLVALTERAPPQFVCAGTAVRDR